MNRIDQAIFESEQEITNGAEAVDAEIVFAELEKKWWATQNSLCGNNTISGTKSINQAPNDAVSYLCLF